MKPETHTPEELRHGRIEQRLAYWTEDGNSFETLAEAQRHDDILVICGHLADDFPEHGLSHIEHQELAEWILEHFTYKEQ